MSLLFERRCVVTVGTMVVSDLRMQFKVHKDNGMKPNTAELTITNLSALSRAAATTKGVPFIIAAGYAGTPANPAGTVANIFSGRVRSADHVRENADWNSVFQSGDGETAYANANHVKSYAGPTPQAQVLSDLLDTMTANGVDTVSAKAVIAGISGVFTKGFTAFGKSAPMIEAMLRSAGYEMSIQDQRMQLVPIDGVAPGAVEVLTPDTGLIGSPAHGTNDGSKLAQRNAGVVKLKCSLRPNITPGCQILVQAEGLSGPGGQPAPLKVVRLEHRGDTHGTDWITEIEAMPYTPGATGVAVPL